jgi:hypothetical protein
MRVLGIGEVSGISSRGICLAPFCCFFVSLKACYWLGEILPSGHPIVSGSTKSTSCKVVSQKSYFVDAARILGEMLDTLTGVDEYDCAVDA